MGLFFKKYNLGLDAKNYWNLSDIIPMDTGLDANHYCGLPTKYEIIARSCSLSNMLLLLISKDKLRIGGQTGKMIILGG